VYDRLFAFHTSYQASTFVARDARVGELIFVKGSVGDHLERIMLSQVDEVVCWRERCGKWEPCTDCREYRVPEPPPLGLAERIPALNEVSHQR
jgi:hypothetical protein